MKTNRSKYYWLTVAIFQVAIGGMISSAAQQPAKSRVQDSEADVAYGAGIRAMNEGRWQAAISSFTKAASDPHSIHGDASLYWKAYSYRRVALRRQSMQTCGQLREVYPTSTWNHDCDALLLEMKQNSGGFSETSGKDLPQIPPAFSDVGIDDDLEVLALNSVIHKSPDEGAAAARRILKSKKTPALKQQVLFVLTQAPAQGSVALLKEAMQGSFGASTQVAAFRVVVQYSTLKTPDVALAAYHSGTSNDVKDAVIDALVKWQDWINLVALAKAEHDPLLRRRLVATISKADDPTATKYLNDLLRR